MLFKILTMTLNIFKYRLVTLFAFSFLLFSSKALIAQEKITIEDYQRAVGFMHENYHNKKAFNLNIRPNWFPDSTGVCYIHHSRSEEHTSELQSRPHLVCRLLLEKKKKKQKYNFNYINKSLIYTTMYQ